jgi:hypothetical protein
MASISGQSFITPADLYTSTASPGDGLILGQIMWDGKTGKAFRYSLAGGSTLVTGNLLQEAAEDTQFENMAVTASLVGQNVANVTNGTTTVAANQFNGGSLSVYTAGGEAVGNEYTIVSHSTGTSGVALTVTLDRNIRTTWTTSAKVNMKRSPWSGVIQAPATTQTGMPVGVAIYPVVNAEYGWVQTHGLASVLSDGSTFAVGTDVGTPSGTAGSATVFAAGTTHTSIGVVRQAAASAKGISVFLRID